MSESRSEPGRRHVFRRGDHIEVRRRPGYYHHGIYVSAERVIQFGGSVWDKPGATIEAVSLDEFQRGCSARAVVHDGRLTATGRHPRPDSPDRIVERAEWLLANHPPGRYDLIGNNCEHMANFCVNEYTESPQVRRFFLLKAGAGALFLWWYAAATRSRRLPTVPILFANLASLLLTASYNVHIARFWTDVGRKWRLAGEQAEQAWPSLQGESFASVPLTLLDTAGRRREFTHRRGRAEISAQTLVVGTHVASRQELRFGRGRLLAARTARVAQRRLEPDRAQSEGRGQQP